MKIIRLIALTCFAFWATFATVAFANNMTDEDYAQWSNLANNSEEILASGRAIESVLENLRKDVAVWRTRLDQEQGVNANRITILKEQITALGATPEDGAVDPFADRRTELNKQLIEMSAPSTRAAESFYRADGIIKEIDKQLLNRQTSALLSRGQSPFDFDAWGLVLKNLTKSFATPFSGINNWFSIYPETFEFGHFFGGLLLSLIGITMAFVGARVIAHRTKDLDQNAPFVMVAVQVLREIVGSLLMPIFGISVLSIGLQSTGILGARGDFIVGELPKYSTWIFFTYWSLRHLLHPETGHLVGSSRLKAIIFASLIVLISRSIFVDLATFDFYSTATNDLVGGIFIIVASYLLFSFCRNLKYRTRPIAPDGDSFSLGRSTLSILVLIGKAIAILSAIATVVGYYKFANFILFPYFNTLLTLALIVALQPILNRVVNVILRRPIDQKSFLSVIVGVIQIFIAMPNLALLWGVRKSDLGELWVTFLDGVKIGGTTLTPLSFLGFFVVFFIGYFITRFIQTALRHSVLPTTKMDIGAQNAIVSGFGYVGIMLAAIIAVSSAGLDLSSLAIVAGALSVGIGFGLQNIVSNFVSGIILLIERPVSEGDWIEVGGQMGYVRNISVRSTRIETFDRSDVIIPNADLVSGVVTNWTRGNTIGRVIIPIGVAYGNDTRRIESILNEIIQAHPMVLLNPEPSVIFIAFGADSLNFEIRAILRDVNAGMKVRSDINHSIAERFAAEGIEIPFAQRDLWIRNPEALRRGNDDNKS